MKALLKEKQKGRTATVAVTVCQRNTRMRSVPCLFLSPSARCECAVSLVQTTCAPKTMFSRAIQRQFGGQISGQFGGQFGGQISEQAEEAKPKRWTQHTAHNTQHTTYSIHSMTQAHSAFRMVFAGKRMVEKVTGFLQGVSNKGRVSLSDVTLVVERVSETPDV